MNRCAHGVFCPLADWRLQDAAGIPPAKRVSWSCTFCREPGENESFASFSTERLLALARANMTAQAIRAAA